jgi:hypothetical protein
MTNPNLKFPLLAEQMDKREFWSVSRGGIELSHNAVLHPGDTEYRVVVWTLCGNEQATVDVLCPWVMSAAEFARRIRLVSSIQHSLQNGCNGCIERFTTSTTPQEKQFLYATNPRLGKILGFDTEGL